MASKVKKVIWFSGRDTIGIALCHDEITDKTKVLVGRVGGHNEKNDTQDILDYGSKINLEMAREIFDHLTDIKIV